MTVKELKDILKNYPDECMVSIADCGCRYMDVIVEEDLDEALLWGFITLVERDC